MRPIKLSDTPKLPDGTTKRVSNYQSWRADLIAAYGDHCAYCNIPMSEKLEVEHVAAKVNPTVDPLDYQNLLLACGNCNREKSTKPYSAATHVLPTIHNPLLFFDYIERTNNVGVFCCIPIPSASLTDAAHIKMAEETIKCMGLDAINFSKDKEEKAIDRRAIIRAEQQEVINTLRELWDETCNVPYIPQRVIQLQVEVIADSFQTSGFFALYYKAFQDAPAVLSALRAAVAGTADDCWGANGEPLWR